MGTPEDLAYLRNYLENTLPSLDISVTTLPLTEIQLYILKSDIVDEELFKEFVGEKVNCF